MTVKEFSAAIEACKITGWTFYASGDKNTYNREKTTTDNTMLLVLPNEYPTWYRGECTASISFEIWLGVKRVMKQTTTGTQQHNPDSSLEQRDTVIAYAKTIITSIAASTKIQLLDTSRVIFFDYDDGQSVNNQMWLKIPIKAKIIKQ